MGTQRAIRAAEAEVDRARAEGLPKTGAMESVGHRFGWSALTASGTTDTTRALWLVEWAIAFFRSQGRMPSEMCDADVLDALDAVLMAAAADEGPHPLQVGPKKMTWGWRGIYASAQRAIWACLRQEDLHY
jgi:hypothetical protein